jgi:hypothetical protein
MRLAGHVLAPISEAQTLRVRQGELAVDDGPVTEQTLQIAGFNILECRDSDEAVVSGEWVLDRQPAGDAGVLVFIRVDDVDASLEKIVEAGGEIVLPRTHEGEGPSVRDLPRPGRKRPRSLPRRRLVAVGRQKRHALSMTHERQSANASLRPFNQARSGPLDIRQEKRQQGPETERQGATVVSCRRPGRGALPVR